VKPPFPLMNPLPGAAETATAPARMAAFFFGAPAEPLFGLYGPPAGAVDRRQAVLLCAAPGHEWLRGYWCFRLLGEQLMRAGFHVFRFDYSGLGNSWGAFEQAGLDRWLADIGAAAQELADNAGLASVSAVGLRLGGTLACLALQNVDHLLLWDPVLDGSAYVRQLRGMQAQLQHTWPSAPPCTPGAAFEDLFGYRYAGALIEQLEQVNLSAAPPPQARRISLLLSTDPTGWAALRSHWAQQPLRIDVRWTPEASVWDRALDYAEPALLATARQAVVDLLQEETP
jgi:hypothetical protein